MSQDNVSKIKERLSIKDIVEPYIKLEKAGTNYKGRCPFHNEKTPSFFVSPDRDSYYCFGCGAKGDIFTFIQEYEGLDFMEAMKMLADKAGVTIEKGGFAKKPKNNILKEVLEETTKFFEKSIKDNSEVLIYLKSRGVEEETIKNWRIGFAPSGWKNLLEYLKDKKFKQEDLEKAGLIKKGEKGDYYDRFRDRIIFPIFNVNGEVVAFTGRIFGPEDDIAKYLNSPETELFRKSEILYGFDKAKQSIRKNNFAILVEGQMDTVMCHQAGYLNTIASSGTAVTETQLNNINKLTSNLVIAYDSDDAGFKASQRAWKTALEIGMDVKVALIKKGLDPADLIKDDLDKWKESIKNSKHIIEIIINKIYTSETDKRKINHRVSIELVPYLHQIKSSIDRHHFIKKVSESFDIPNEAIIEEVNSYKDEGEEPGRISQYENKAVSKRDVDDLALEKRTFGILYALEKKDAEKFKEMQEGIINIVGQQEYDRILESISDELEEIIFAVENSFDKENIYNESTELLKNIKLRKLNKERKESLLQLKKVEQENDESLENDLLNKINKISKEIQDLN